MWFKKGKLFSGFRSDPYLISHAANPVPIILDRNTCRIFYNGRDIKKRASIGFVDIDIETKEVINQPKDPIFTFNQESSFYTHGVSLGNIFQIDGVYHLSFMGWQKRKELWCGLIGIIELNNTLDQAKIKTKEPIISLDEIDPISLSYPWITKENDLYKMWYGSTLSWDAGNGEMLHVINYAISLDCVNWTKQGTCLPYQLGKVQAFSKPTVLFESGIYHMWFSYRAGNGDKYKIGYAKSLDGEKWSMDLNKNIIEPSKSGWDSEMICYPYVFKYKERPIMIYNGNNYGKTGFGLAQFIDQL